MTVIESIRNFIGTCPHLSEFAKGINVDYLELDSQAYMIEVVPSKPIVKKYIDGSSIRQCIFVFVSRESYGSNVIENIENIGFYEKFATWIEDQCANKNFPIMDEGKQATKIETTTNGYAFYTSKDKAQYQIQCKLTYYQGG